MAHPRLKLGTAAASRPYLGSMAGGSPALLGFLCVSAPLRENICGDLRHSRVNFLSSSFGEDVVEGAGGGRGGIGRSVRGPSEGEIDGEGVGKAVKGINIVNQSQRGIGDIRNNRAVVIVIEGLVSSSPDCEVAHGEVSAGGAGCGWGNLPEARNGFGDVIGIAFLRDGFYGIGGDGE